MVANLAENLDEAHDQYLWDMSTLPAGVYSVRAHIRDDEHTVVVDACCTMTLLPQNKTATVTALAATVLEEGGDTSLDVQLVLDQPPRAGTTVTVNLAVSDASELELIGASYVAFNEHNWNQAQTIRLQSVDDCEIDGDQQSQLVFARIESDDPAYQGLVLDSLSITTRDDEHSEQTLFICDYQLVSETSVSEGAALRVDSEYRPLLTNCGEPLQSVTATLIGVTNPHTDATLTINTDSVVQFTTVAAGADTSATNTVVVRRDPSQPFDPAQLRWSFQIGDIDTAIQRGSSDDDQLRGNEQDNTLEGLAGHDLLWAVQVTIRSLVVRVPTNYLVRLATTALLFKGTILTQTVYKAVVVTISSVVVMAMMRSA